MSLSQVLSPVTNG